MANYSNNFNALTVASGVPTGLTSRWDAGTWAVLDTAGDRYIRESSAAGNRYFLSLDAIDGDAGRNNVEVLMRIRASSLATPSQTYLGAIMRASGNGTTETGYGVLVVTGSPNLRIVKYSAGTNTPLATSASTITFAANTWYWLRARVNGSTIQGRVWADGASENPAFWDVEFTDSSITAAGWAGLFGFIGGVNKDFGDIAIATNGDTAVMGASATLVTGANSTQANTVSGGAVKLTHLVTGANSSQANTVSGGMAGQSTDSLVTGANSSQANTVSGGAVNQMHLVTGANSSQANTVSGASAGLAPVVIRADYERSSVNLAGSSVTGTGDASVVVIKPRVQESEVKGSLTAWLEPSAKVTGVNGIRPTFRFSDYASTWSDGKYHGVPWGTGRRPMFSYDDGLTWTYFDTQTITGTYIEFRHNTAFTSGSVLIGRERQVNVTQIGQWIEALAAAHPGVVVPTASAAAFTPVLTTGWPAQAFIAAEFSSQVNELGEAIPPTPFYAFAINDTSMMPPSGAKRVGIMTAGVHAGEDTGTWAFMRAVENLLGNSAAALYVRKQILGEFYPTMNSPGRVGGGWRGSYMQGLGGADDANRHYNETNSGLEIVDKPKASQTTDRAAALPVFMFDWHSAFESNWGYFSGSSAITTFGAILSAKFGTTFDDKGPLASGAQSEYWRNSIGVPLAMTLEFGNLTPVTDAKYVDLGQAFVESLQSWLQYVEVGNCSQANTVSGGAIKQTHLVTGANSTQANTVSGGAVGIPGATLVTAANSTQANSVSGGAIKQTHLVGAASCHQPNTASPIVIQQAHIVRFANSSQANTVSGASAGNAAAILVIGANSSQANTASGVSIKQTHLVRASDSIQANRAAGGSVSQVNDQPAHISQRIGRAVNFKVRYG